MRVRRSADDLRRSFRALVGFLERSAAAYDAGLEDEAARLAATLRVLLHDTRNSTSALAQLGVKAQLEFHDVTSVPLNSTFHIGVGMGFTETGVKYYPNLGEPTRRLPFDAWWDGIVLVNQAAGVRVARRDAVLEIANTDGGAHLDPTLDAEYHALTRDNALGWQVWVGGAVSRVENSPAHAIVRQVTHEVLGTIREQLSELLSS